jgi:hypothetical protein
MGRKLALAALLLASMAQAQEPKKYHAGRLLQMESLQCTVFENPKAGGKEPDSALCQEYVLQGDEVLFHLRARDTKHPLLLPVGKDVEYRIEEDRFFLRLEAGDRSDKKDHEYAVLSMEPADKPAATTQTAMKINHLQ